MSAVGAEMISNERQRQIDVEGYTVAHDSEHADLSLIKAADEYLGVAEFIQLYPNDTAGIHRDIWLKVEDLHGFPATRWPWAPEYFKPSPDPIRNLVKAGALIAAEIDRLSATKAAQS